MGPTAGDRGKQPVVQMPAGWQICSAMNRAQSSFICARQLFPALSFAEETGVAAVYVVGYPEGSCPQEEAAPCS